MMSVPLATHGTPPLTSATGLPVVVLNPMVAVLVVFGPALTSRKTTSLAITGAALTTAPDDVLVVTGYDQCTAPVRPSKATMSGLPGVVPGRSVNRVVPATAKRDMLSGQNGQMLTGVPSDALYVTPPQNT